jgi:hypothetical protein
MRKLSYVFMIGLLAGSAVEVAAQAWDVPSFFSPRPGEDIGIYVVDMDGADDLGIVGIWRQEGNLNLGVRAGVLDGDHISLGAEFYGPIRGVNAPIYMSWLLGAGGTFNGVTWLRIPCRRQHRHHLRRRALCGSCPTCIRASRSIYVAFDTPAPAKTTAIRS